MRRRVAQPHLTRPATTHSRARARTHTHALTLSVTDEDVAHSLMLTRGVHAVLVQPGELLGEGGGGDVVRMRALALRYVKEWGVAKEGDKVVLCHGSGADLTEGVCVTVASVK